MPTMVSRMQRGKVFIINDKIKITYLGESLISINAPMNTSIQIKQNQDMKRIDTEDMEEGLQQD